MDGCAQLMLGNFRQGLIEKIVSFPSDLLFSPRFSVQCYEGKKQYDSLWIFMKLADLMIGSLNLLYCCYHYHGTISIHTRMDSAIIGSCVHLVTCSLDGQLENTILF